MHREKEEELTLIHYHGKGRDGTIVKDEMPLTFPSRRIKLICDCAWLDLMSDWRFLNWLIPIPHSTRPSPI